jgi:hypothetical protein
MEGWTIEVIDIEAAFLEGTLEEWAYIEWPEGMVELGYLTKQQARPTVTQLLKSMYGNINTALIFFKEYVGHMCSKEMGVYQNLADPCVFVKRHEGRLVLLAFTHVDDTQLCGEKHQWFELFKKNIKKQFNYTALGTLKKHSGIWYNWTVGEKGGTIIIATMPKMVKEIINALYRRRGKSLHNPRSTRCHFGKEHEY